MNEDDIDALFGPELTPEQPDQVRRLMERFAKMLENSGLDPEQQIAVLRKVYIEELKSDWPRSRDRG